MVTTFLVAIAFDPNNPSEKKPYGPFAHRDPAGTGLDAPAPAHDNPAGNARAASQREYHYEVCQPDIISANWTPGRSFEDLAGKTAVETPAVAYDTVGMSQSFLREGELLQGRSRKHDGIRDLIEAG
jgi:hypothetical protein